MKKNQGFTIIEMMVAASLGGIGMMIFSSFFSLTTSMDKKTIKTNEVHLDVAAALQNIKRIGRTAQVCRRIVGPPIALECDGDWGFGAMTYRMEIDGDDGMLVRQKVGAGAWVNKGRYRSIATLQVCNDDDVSKAACAIVNPLPVTPDPASDRFFRVQLVGRLDDEETAADAHVKYRSAFFTRNADPLAPGVTMGFEHSTY